MIYDLKRTPTQGILCCFLLLIQSTAIYSADDPDSDQITGRAKLGERCWSDKCEENLICNRYFICECEPGYRPLDNICVPGAGENEPCETQEDCCGKLLCINGICRRPIPSSEFLSFSKICLGITLIALIIATFSSLLKFIVRYDRSRAFERNDPSSTNFREEGQYQSSQARLNEIRDEKPPSYDECVRVPTGVEPPPYTIATNTVSSIQGLPRGPVSQTVNLSAVNQPNSTPLNAQALCSESNPNVTIPQNSDTIQNGSNSSAKK